MNQRKEEIMGKKTRFTIQLMGVGFIMVVSYMLLLCCQLTSCSYAAGNVRIPPIPNQSGFTKEMLLKKKLDSDSFPKINTQFTIRSFKTKNRRDHGSFPNAVRVDVKAVDESGKDYFIREKDGVFVLWYKTKKNATAFMFRIFFHHHKFHDGTVQKVEFSVSKRSTEGDKNEYILHPDGVNISYEKGGISYSTKKNNDEIVWIEDKSPNRFAALLVCDGKCDDTLASIRPNKCKYQIGSDGTSQCKRDFHDALQNFLKENLKEELKDITEETTLKLTTSFAIVPPQKNQPSNTDEDETNLENGGGEDTSGGPVKSVALKEVQFKPYMKLYGEPIVNRACQYALVLDDSKQIQLVSKAEQGYFFAEDAPNKQVKEGEKLTVKVIPKQYQENKCISEIKDIPISLNDGIATVEFEIPHKKPWLLVYATSVGFPNKSGNRRENSERRIFWTRIFDKIDYVYTDTALNPTLHWLTVDVFKPQKNKEPKWLAGGNETKKPVNNEIDLEKLTGISQIPINDISPSFEDYEKAILEDYKEKHSTQNNGKYDNVVIIQGNDSFSGSICTKFESFAQSLEEQKISILYINPVGKDIPDGYTTGSKRKLKLLDGSDWLPIYTCKKPDNEQVSKLITFEYFEHKDADKWKAVQERLEDELQKIKELSIP